jgi:hypothetical protein
MLAAVGVNELQVHPRGKGRHFPIHWCAAGCRGGRVELPDHFADGGLGGAVVLGDAVELVNQALAMNPAQATLAELNWRRQARAVATTHSSR